MQAMDGWTACSFACAESEETWPVSFSGPQFRSHAVTSPEEEYLEFKINHNTSTNLYIIRLPNADCTCCIFIVGLAAFVSGRIVLLIPRSNGFNPITSITPYYSTPPRSAPLCFEGQTPRGENPLPPWLPVQYASHGVEFIC